MYFAGYDQTGIEEEGDSLLNHAFNQTTEVLGMTMNGSPLPSFTFHMCMSNLN